MSLALRLKSAKLRLFIATTLAVISYLITPEMKSKILRLLISWNIGTWSMIIMAWIIILASNARATKARVDSTDPGHLFVHVVVLLSAAFSLIASIALMREHEAKVAHEALWWVVCLAGVIGSWILNHTSWTLRYARLYYRTHRHRSGTATITHEDVGGLTFPGDENYKPDDLDFAYFAFTIGSCFQVSDVMITNNKIRRVVLSHSIQSFAYNTAILSLMLNVVFGILK